MENREVSSLMQTESNIKIPVFWFIFFQNELLVDSNENSISIPYSVESFIPEEEIFASFTPGFIKNCTYKAISLKSKTELRGKRFLPLRSLLGRIDDETFFAAGKSYHLLNWNLNHSFCGKCGSQVLMKTDEIAKYCPTCSLVVYPRISPAVIVAVIKENKILLAHSGRFKNKMYSVLAGFVEPGETFEQCIHREICEEVNINVQNIRYFGSQPWPFPDSIMVGFIADYKSGELKPDGKEIMDAGWFDKDNLPEIPGKWSIAGKLIDWFIHHF